MWLSISTRPDITNAVRDVARYCTAPRAIHWKAALGILEYINETSEYGITFQRGTLSGISLEVFADAARGKPVCRRVSRDVCGDFGSPPSETGGWNFVLASFNCSKSHFIHPGCAGATGLPAAL